LLFFLLAPAAGAEDSVPPSTAALARQADDNNSPLLKSQPHADAPTLELAPQPSVTPSPPNSSSETAARKFQQSDDVAALNREFKKTQPDDGRRPYLGFELEYTSQCLFGMEMHGFEVLSIAPNSPAAHAGLQARKPATALGNLAALGSVLAFPVGLFTVPRLRRSGALGMPGDLIVAVDDRRVRTEEEFMHAIDPLRAGDTVYVTVIRPIVGGSHQTLRIAMHIDETLPPPAVSRNP
jgi:S1-C subfamily serine protease